MQTTTPEQEAIIIEQLRELLKLSTPGNWSFKTFFTAMDGDEEIDVLTADDPDEKNVMWVTGDWKGKSNWIEFNSEADKMLLERAKMHGETCIRIIDRLQTDNKLLRTACENVIQKKHRTDDYELRDVIDELRFMLDKTDRVTRPHEGHSNE